MATKGQRDQQMQVHLQPPEQCFNRTSGHRSNRGYQDAPNQRGNRIEYDKPARRDARDADRNGA